MLALPLVDRFGPKSLQCFNLTAKLDRERGFSAGESMSSMAEHLPVIDSCDDCGAVARLSAARRFIASSTRTARTPGSVSRQIFPRSWLSFLLTIRIDGQPEARFTARLASGSMPNHDGAVITSTGPGPAANSKSAAPTAATPVGGQTWARNRLPRLGQGETMITTRLAHIA